MDELYHHGIKGQKWGVRRYQNKDGTYTSAGKKRLHFNAQALNPVHNIKSTVKENYYRGMKNTESMSRTKRSLAVGGAITAAIAFDMGRTYYNNSKSMHDFSKTLYNTVKDIPFKNSAKYINGTYAAGVALGVIGAVKVGQIIANEGAAIKGYTKGSKLTSSESESAKRAFRKANGRNAETAEEKRSVRKAAKAKTQERVKMYNEKADAEKQSRKLIQYY